MNLNIVDVIILAVLALSVISGMYKGFLASALSLAGFVAAFFGAQQFYPQLSAAIQSNSSLMNVLTYYLDASSIFKTVGMGESLVQGATQNGLLAQAVSELKLKNIPDAVVNAFQSNVDRQVFSGIGFTDFAQYLNQTIWSSVINVASFLLMFIISYLVVLLIVNLLNSVFHFPLLKHLDWLLGGVFGAVRGLVFVSLILAVVPMAMSVVNIDVVSALISESSLAHYFPTDFAIGDIIVKAFTS